MFTFVGGSREETKQQQHEKIKTEETDRLDSFCFIHLRLKINMLI